MAQSLLPRSSQFTKATAAAANAKRKPGSNDKKLVGDLRDLRIQQVLDMRLRGMGVADIAKEFNCHPDTIRDDIYKARQTGLITKYRHQLMKRLVPKAFGVIEHHLAKNNLKAAEQVMALFRSESDRQHEKEVAKESAEESLSDWWQRRKEQLVGSGLPLEAPEIVEAPHVELVADIGQQIGQQAPAPTSPSGPSDSRPSGSDVGSEDAAPQAAPSVSSRDEQTGVALPAATTYHFGPGGFNAFADANALGHDPEAADEGI